MDDLISFYRRSVGSLPCQLGAACARDLTEREVRELVREKPPPRYQGKRRRGEMEVEEMLIVNRES